MEQFSSLHHAITGVRELQGGHAAFWQEGLEHWLNLAATEAKKRDCYFVLGEGIHEAVFSHEGGFNLEFPFKLPYPVTIVEYDAKVNDGPGKNETSARCITVCVEQENNCVLTWTMSKTRDLGGRYPFAWCGELFIYELTTNEGGDLVGAVKGSIVSDEGVKKLPAEDYTSLALADSSVTAGVLFYMLRALKCNNVVEVRHQAPDKLNKKRARTGQLPVYGFTTLHLEQKRATRTEREHQESLRASPRLHFRRGHVRRLQDGQFTWVSSSMVGQIKQGIKRKEYNL